MLNRIEAFRASSPKEPRLAAVRGAEPCLGLTMPVMVLRHIDEPHLTPRGALEFKVHRGSACPGGVLGFALTKSALKPRNAAIEGSPDHRMRRIGSGALLERADPRDEVIEELTCGRFAHGGNAGDVSRVGKGHGLPAHVDRFAAVRTQRHDCFRRIRGCVCRPIGRSVDSPFRRCKTRRTAVEKRLRSPARVMLPRSAGDGEQRSTQCRSHLKPTNRTPVVFHSPRALEDGSQSGQAPEPCASFS